MPAPVEHGEREKYAAQAQSMFRTVNEQIRNLSTQFPLVGPAEEWLCECAERTCLDRIAMSTDQYEAIRADGARFLVRAGDEHVWPDIERVVERTDRYWILEKVGHAGELARLVDPRAAEKPSI
jgi:hypothetical protein